MATATTSFTVVVTCYNYRDFVVEAVDSALAQTRAPAQVIVVDDGSTDGSTQLLSERYGNDARVELVFRKNGGQLAAFQTGVSHANTDAVAFLDADDRWSPDYLEKIGELLDRRRDVDFVFTDLRHFGNEERHVGYADREMDFGYTVVSVFMLAHWYGAPTSALVMRTQWARRTLDLPPDQLETWRICADMCLVHGASILGARKYFLPTGSVHYRIHGNNGWFGQTDAKAQFLNRYRARTLVRSYAARIGLTDWCLEDVKYEFRTKTNPSWREVKRYAKLSMLRPGGYFKNLERALSILHKGWRGRKNAPVEARVPP